MRKCEPWATLQKDIKQAIGREEEPKLEGRHKEEAQTILSEAREKQSAKDHIRQLKAMGTGEDVERVEWCNIEVPQNTNAYTDGSMKKPGSQTYPWEAAAYGRVVP